MGQAFTIPVAGVGVTRLEESWCLCPGAARASQWGGSVNGAAIGKQGLQEGENSQ